MMDLVGYYLVEELEENLKKIKFILKFPKENMSQGIKNLIIPFMIL